MIRLLCVTALSLLVSAGNAVAGGLNQLQEAYLVPYVKFDTSLGDFSTAGILHRHSGNLHWVFFDANGNRRAFGSRSVNANETTVFNWITEANASGVPGLGGVDGFVLFALDTNNDGRINSSDSQQGLSVSAFLVNLTNNDAAYIPAFGIDRTYLSSSTISNWTQSPITDVGQTCNSADVEENNGIYARYLIDGDVGTGDNTFLIFWHTDPLPSTLNATIYDGEGVSRSIDLRFLNNNLNVIDRETNSGVTPAFHGGGFVKVNIPSGTAGSVTGFSRTQFPFVGAEQTLMFDVLD